MDNRHAKAGSEAEEGATLALGPHSDIALASKTTTEGNTAGNSDQMVLGNDGGEGENGVTTTGNGTEGGGGANEDSRHKTSRT